MVTNLADDGDTANIYCTNKLVQIKKCSPVTTFYSSNAFGSELYAKLGKRLHSPLGHYPSEMDLIECIFFKFSL